MARASLRASWLWVLLAAGGLALGWTADVSQEAATWWGVRGPHCPLGTCLGPLHCPGCGLVRSTSSSLQGSFEAAWAFHPGGLVVAALLPMTLIVHLDILRRRREHPYHHLLRRAGRALFMSAVLIGWIARYLIRS